MTLATFHTLVSTEIKRGTTLDSQIPAATKRAARWIERNYTLQYMRRFLSFTLDTTSAAPRALSLPSSLLKQIYFLRIVNDDSTYTYLQRVEPQEISSIEEKKPSAYWLDGVDYIWLNNTPDENYSCELYVAQYTDWPSDTSQTPWLIEHAEDVMLYRTIKNLVGPGRLAAETAAVYQNQFMEGIKSLIDADQEIQFSGRSDSMNFGVEY